MGLRLLTPYVPYMPHPKQALFLSDAMNGVREVLYGGAAGGGKSDALLMAALQYVDVPGYSAAIMRRTYAELTQQGGILDRMHKWMRRLRYVQDPDGRLRLSPGQDIDPNANAFVSAHAAPGDGKTLVEWGLAHWNAGEWRYEFPSGARISFGHLQTEEAKTRYQGGEYHFIGVDELTLLNKTQFTFLGTRLRKPDPPTDPEQLAAAYKRAAEHGVMEAWMIPLRLRAGSNPGGRGHKWVKDRFIGDPKKGIAPSKRNARFIPATLEDNPSVGASYEESLSVEDGVTYRQLRFGSWDDVIAGEYFQRTWFTEVDELDTRGAEWVLGPIRYWDLAATEKKKKASGADANDPDYAVGLKLAFDGYEWWILDLVRLQNEPAGVDRAIDRVAELDGAGTEIWVEQEPGASGKMVVSTIARRLGRRVVQGHRPTGSKLARARVVSSKVRQRLVRIVRAGWNEDFYDELEAFTGNEDEDDHDDQVDALSGAFDRLGAAGEAETTDGTEPVEDPNDNDDEDPLDEFRRYL